MGIGRCTNCGIKYYHNWPVGHGVDFPISFDDQSSSRYPQKSKKWLAEPLITAIRTGSNTTASVERMVRQTISDVLLLNCLDPCYGHILWKLFNAIYYQDLEDSQGIIVLIPANCQWLVPDFVAEVWSVDIEIDLLGLPIPQLDDFIREMTNQYDSMHILPASTHIDHGKFDLKPFLRIDKFDLVSFSKQQVCITFIWRQDRFWLSSTIGEWLNLIAIKYSQAWINQWLARKQLQKIKQVADLVLEQIPNAKFKVTGLGTYGIFPEYFNDLRQNRPDPKTEIEWCSTYQQSQLVIGVHGSNMLIPTALAAGFIELIPKSKLPFITEDILMKHPARFQTFLGRHLDLLTSAKLIAAHAISMIKDFDYLYKHTLAES